MQGVLYVADEGDELPELPETAPSRNFVRMWKLDDFSSDIDRDADVSLQRGREVFSVAGCIKCHAIGGAGTNLGPDLSDVHKRFQGTKLLKQILEPSAEINKDYQTYVVTTSDGTLTAGLMVKEKPDEIHLLPNPLKPHDVVVINRNDIDEITASQQSTMPKGLLMTLTRDEILDLLHYVQSGGIASPAGSSVAPLKLIGDSCEFGSSVIPWLLMV